MTADEQTAALVDRTGPSIIVIPRIDIVFVQQALSSDQPLPTRRDTNTPTYAQPVITAVLVREGSGQSNPRHRSVVFIRVGVVGALSRRA